MSKVKQTFRLTSSDGNKPLEFYQWANQYLTNKELEQYNLAVSRQTKLRQDAINAGHMIWDKSSNSYIWDQEWINGKQSYEFKEYDEEWLMFFNRYLDETGNNFSSTIEEE